MSVWFCTCLPISCLSFETGTCLPKNELSVQAVEKRRFETDNLIWKLACSSDGNLIAVANADVKGGKIDLWETSAGKKSGALTRRAWRHGWQLARTEKN